MSECDSCNMSYSNQDHKSHNSNCLSVDTIYMVQCKISHTEYGLRRKSHRAPHEACSNRQPHLTISDTRALPLWPSNVTLNPYSCYEGNDPPQWLSSPSLWFRATPASPLVTLQLQMAHFSCHSPRHKLLENSCFLHKDTYPIHHRHLSPHPPLEP